MIKRYVPLNNLEYTIEKPIVANFTKQFATRFLKDPDIFVAYTEDADRFGSGMYDTDFSTQYIKNWLEVAYTVTNDDDIYLTNSIRDSDGLLLIRDPEIDFNVYTISLSKKYRVNLKIHSKYKNYLKKLLTGLQFGQIDDTNYMRLNATIFFTIPNVIVELMQNICYLKYKKSELWGEYLSKFSVMPLIY